MAQTQRQLAGNQRRTLRKMREQLLRMADAWEDFDEFNRSELTDLADKVESVATGMAAEDGDG
jgi:hypothetical protein